jgi:hypothetical protein
MHRICICKSPAAAPLSYGTTRILQSNECAKNDQKLWFTISGWLGVGHGKGQVCNRHPPDRLRPVSRRSRSVCVRITVAICRLCTAVARSWVSVARMARKSRLHRLFVSLKRNGAEVFQCKCCGNSFSKPNAYRHSRPDSPKHCLYLYAHDNEETLHLTEWVSPVRFTFSPIVACVALWAPSRSDSADHSHPLYSRFFRQLRNVYVGERRCIRDRRLQCRRHMLQ